MGLTEYAHLLRRKSKEVKIGLRGRIKFYCGRGGYDTQKKTSSLRGRGRPGHRGVPKKKMQKK